MNKGISIVHHGWVIPQSFHVAITSRHGGQSELPYAGLNLATHVGDELQNVLANREALGRYLGLPSQPHWLTQRHSDVVIDIDRRCDLDSEYVADGSYSADAGVVLAVLVADCVPVVLLCEQSQEIAVVHAGWRGLLNGILSNAVQKFSGKTLTAYIGPAIGACHFEVGAEVRNEFLSAGYGGQIFPGVDRSHWMIDLPAVAIAQLHCQSVESVFSTGSCTACQVGDYYSYRVEGCTGRFAMLAWRD